MLSFKAGLTNELLRLFKKNKIFVFIVLDIIICILFKLGLKLLNLTDFQLNPASMSITILSVFTNVILPIYIIMMTMETFTAQYTDKTILNILSRPITRFKIYLSKITTIVIFTFIHLMILLLLSFVLGFSYNISVGRLILAFVISIYPMIAFISVIALIAQIVKNSLLGMLLSIIILLGTKVFQILFITPSAYLFTTYLDWFKIFIKNSPSLQHILVTFALITGYGIFSFVLGYMIFDRKEF